MLKVISVETNIEKTFRVNQVKTLFDVPLENKLTNNWTLDVPDDLSGIGVIVGNSGAGKSTVAREVFAKLPNHVLHTEFEWGNLVSVLDCFPKKINTTDIVAAFNAVGFSSPPSWLKPYRVLSTGEKFRCELARAILEYKDKTFIFDEFTSVVDRNVKR